MRQLVTLEQAHEARPCLSVRMLRRLVAEKRVPYFKPAGRVLFDLIELDAWIESGRVEASS